MKFQSRGEVPVGIKPIARSYGDMIGMRKPVMQMTAEESKKRQLQLMAQQAQANQATLRPMSAPIDREATMERNRQYAASTGKRFNPNTGGVSPMLSDNTDRTMRRIQENIVNPMFEIEMGLVGAGLVGRGAKSLGKYAVENTALKNASNLNPWAYQYNLPKNTMWRGLGKEGMEDAVESGLFRAKQNIVPEYYPGRNFQMNKSFGENPYFTPKFNTAATYGDTFIAEVPKSSANWKQRYKRSDWSQISDRPIPITEGRILQKDWLRGYKEVPTPATNNRFSVQTIAPGRTIQTIKEGAYNPEFYYIDEFGIRKPKGIDAAGMRNSNTTLSKEDMPKLYSELNKDEWKTYYRDQRMMRNNNNIDYLQRNYFKDFGGPVVDPRGQWAFPGMDTIIPTSNGQITMQGVPYPVYGEDETGYGQMMYPGGEYIFPGQMVYEKPMMQKGGSLPKYQIEGQVERRAPVDNTRQVFPIKTVGMMRDYQYAADQFDNAKIFHEAWMQSPMYKKMIERSDPKNAKDITDIRKKNLKSTTFRYVPEQPANHPRTGGYSNSNTGKITFLPHGVGARGMGTHEMSHSIDRPAKLDMIKAKLQSLFTGDYSEASRLIPTKDVDKIQNITSENYLRNRDMSNEDSEWFDYITDPTETRARLNDIRQQSAQHGLYDPFTQMVTPEVYKNKLKKFKFDKGKTRGFDALKQLRDVYTDQQIINLLNSVSKNNSEIGLDQAKYGGGLLSRSVTCSTCGHSWKSVEGGADPLHCHKCGGLVKMQGGGLWNKNKAQWVDSVNNANINKNFIQRMYLKNGPSVQIPGQEGRSTHFMEESDGKIYPTVVQSQGRSSVQYINESDKNAAYNYAMKTGQFIQFPTVEQAQWYSNNGYKTGKGVLSEFANGGYTVTRSSDRKGKTHKVTGPDGTVKYFGDSKLGQHPKDPQRKAAFYARHKSNLAGNPYFRAFARKTWEEGGSIELINNDVNPDDNNQYTQAMETNYEKGGEMIRRANGSYSPRGLWDNVLANKGSGKKPTKEMLQQERKIKAKEMKNGGTNNEGFRALPEYVQANILSNMGYGGYYNPMMADGGTYQDIIDRLQKREERLVAKGYKAVDEGREKKADRILGRAARVEDRKIRLMEGMDFGGYYDPMSLMQQGGEPNGEMALGQMAAVSDKMSKLLKFVRPEQNLDPWIASKLAVMDDSADAIADYMMYGPDAQEMEEQMRNGGYIDYRGKRQMSSTPTWSGNMGYEDGGETLWHANWNDTEPSYESVDPMMEQFNQDVASMPARPVVMNLPVNAPATSKKTAASRSKGSSYSVVDFMNSQGMASDYATRKALAEQLGIKGYRGTADQNMMLISALSQGAKSQGSKAASVSKQSGSADYDMNSSNMLRRGYNAPTNPFMFGQMSQRQAGIAENPAVKTPGAANSATAKKVNAANAQDAEEAMTFAKYKAQDPYFFAEESDPGLIKAIDYPFTMLRDLGARTFYDQDPIAVAELLALGLGSHALRGKTKIEPYYGGQKALPRMPGKALPAPAPPAARVPRGPIPGPASGGYLKPRVPGQSPRGFEMPDAGLRSPGYPRFAQGGPVIGDEMEVTPEQLEQLRAQGYQFEII